MTAIAFCVDPQDGIFIASDGALYESGTGVLQGFVSKVVLMPEIDAVFAMRGNGGFFPALQSLIVARFTDFDGLIANIESLTKEAFDAYVEAYDARDATITLIVGGFSREKNGFAAFRLSSSERPIKHGDETEIAPAWRPDPIEGIWVAPLPPKSTYAQFGIESAPTLETHQDIINYLARMVCAARQTPISGDDSQPGYVPYTVGGFLQTSVVTRQGYFTAITHRWPDVVGEPIDPSRGQPIPAFLMPDRPPL